MKEFLRKMPVYLITDSDVGLFGAGLATDAFNVAFRIPNLLRDLFAEGAMSAALVPNFLRVRSEEGDRKKNPFGGLFGACSDSGPG